MRYLLVLCAALAACTSNEKDADIEPDRKGTLFIIGGGSRPTDLLKELVDISEVSNSYGLVLPMASAEPDSAAYYAIRQFDGLTNAPIRSMFISSDRVRENQLDSIRNAAMIYITGGDQRRFMDTTENSGLEEAILDAYNHGATIAGTSAGAAMMSSRMITGDEKRHPEYSSTYRHIEHDNMIVQKGLGLIDDIIVDQHFVKRSRYNRLITAVLEYPDLLGVGIDESTAAVISGDSLYTVGDSQVVVIQNMDGTADRKGTLIGGKDLRMHILLPGEMIKLNRADQTP